jgi:hypothetical protein
LVRNRAELHLLSFELGVTEAVDKKEGDILYHGKSEKNRIMTMQNTF